MSPIEFSICQSYNETTQNLEDALRPFNERQRADSRVQLHPLQWEDYRQELTWFAIHNQGPDVSQVGAPVVNDMAAMNVLRPFTRRDINEMGGQEAFTKAAWDSAQPLGEGNIWSLPWYQDARAILFWRDMLEEAGADPKTAFNSFDQMEEAFEKLQAAGTAAPWSLPTGHKLGTLQSALSWLWGAGGKVVAEDGKTPLFAEPAALDGLQRYFSLGRFLPVETPLLSMAQSLDNFTQRRAAATMANLQLAQSILNNTPEMAPHLGIALPPGPPYVGGSNLVVWKHSRHEDQAVQLVQHLLGQQAQLDYCRLSGNLPVRRATLAKSPYTDDPLNQVFVQAVEKGRSFPVFRLSGLLEERLATTLAQVWTELAQNPSTNLEELLAQFLKPTAGRLKSVLQ
jgi:multiple sugar transport system substrate-binding protein